MCFESELEPPAPVMGGARWRRRFHDIADMCRSAGRFVFGAPPPAEPEPGAVLNPQIVSLPPPEARVGREYVYHARAQAANIDGFTWYFEESAPGMAVDRHTGRVTWLPSDGGYVEVVLCARSVYGASSRQGWTLCVRKAAPLRKCAPNPRYAAAALRKRLRRTRRLRFFWLGTRRRIGLPGRAAAPPGAPQPVAVPLRI